jgi:XTP/dITP diphosphohydrolase
MKLYFVTSNEHKKREVKQYVKDLNIKLEFFNKKIQEILDFDLQSIVKNKCFQAFEEVRLPCVVEHGGLEINSLNGFPSGISKVFWDKLGEKICTIIPMDDRRATAKVIIGYCNGKNIKTFTGITNGMISLEPKGIEGFQWDPIFIPDGSSKTLSELGIEGKKKFAPAPKAWKQLSQEINNNIIKS